MARTSVTLTDANVRTLKPSEAGRETFYWDEATPGFGLRIRETGARSLVAQYKLGSVHRRMTLGTVGKIRVKQARKDAIGYFEQVARGEDPAAKRAEKKVHAAHTFRIGVDDFLKHYRQHGWKNNGVRERTAVETERYLMDHAKPLHPMAIRSIKRQHISDWLGKIATTRGGVTANRARSAVSTFFQWAIAEGLCDDNPTRGTVKRRERKRERVLSDQELADIWLNSPDGEYGTILKLLMLTGCRRDEIARLRWSEVDTVKRIISLPKGRMKADQRHDVWLTDAALALLPPRPEEKRQFVFGLMDTGFQGFSKPKLALDKRLDAVAVERTGGKTAKFETWTPHSFRHTIETQLNEHFGIQPHVTNALLAHKTGAGKSGSQGTYNHATYFEERKSALEIWSSHIMVQVAKATGANVTQLPARA
jgi:integrase